MKIEIENSIKNPITEKIFNEFNEIIKILLKAKTREDIKKSLSKNNLNFFKFGFGSNHFWLAQRAHSPKDEKRILYIDLTNFT
jgi:hypothetical protein